MRCSRLPELALAGVGAVLGTKWLLGTGLAAVGLSVDLAAFRGAGLAPFAVGAAGSPTVVERKSDGARSGSSR